jgi:hypothetical protein
MTIVGMILRGERVDVLNPVLRRAWLVLAVGVLVVVGAVHRARLAPGQREC